MISARANDLDEQIRTQDTLIATAYAQEVPGQFIRAAVEVRNKLVRELALEWQRSA